MGPAAVIITGGHAPGLTPETQPDVVDLVFDGKPFTNSDAAHRDAPYARHRLHVCLSGRRRTGARPRAARKPPASRSNTWRAPLAHGIAIGHGRGPLNHFWKIGVIESFGHLVIESSGH